MEHFYRHFYHRHLPDLSQDSTSREENLTVRLQNLLDISLQVGEAYFGLKQKGNIIERCRRLEEAGWNYIYRLERAELKQLSPLKRGLADWIAAEADLRMLHMRLVESFVAVTGTYIQDKPCFERFAETTLILFDAIARIKGTKNPRRPRLGWRKSRVTIGEPISVSDRAIDYQQNREGLSPEEVCGRNLVPPFKDRFTSGACKRRQGAKEAVAQLTQDLQTALAEMIV
jgi:hypothetical protein